MLIKLAFHLLALLPLSALHALGGWIGRLLWRFDDKRRTVALKNLEIAFPEWTPAQREQAARQSLQHELAGNLEAPWFWLSGTPQSLWDHERKVTGEELVLAARERGKGTILCTLHLGGWEMCGHAYARRWPISGIYKPQGGVLEELGLRGRSRTGAKLIPAVGGTVTALSLEALARNECIYVMPDQDPPEGRGAFAPLFGTLAHTPTLVSKLAQRSGAAVLFAYCKRLPGGAGYETTYIEADAAIYSEDLVASVSALNRGVERCIRECPEQYWWSYRRYRRRPPGEKPFY